MTYQIFGILTILFLMFSAIQDIKERAIYSFPTLLFTAWWFFYSIRLYADDIPVLIALWSIVVFLYVIFKRFHIWGDGDSDMFLLFSAIIICTFEGSGIYGFLLHESIALSISLILSLFIGYIEALIRKRGITKRYGIAVIPGCSLVLITLILSRLFNSMEELNL